MRLVRVISVLVALCLAVQFMGCSWILMDRAPDDYRTREIHCSGEEWPIVDTISGSILSTATVALSIAAGFASDKQTSSPPECLGTFFEPGCSPPLSPRGKMIFAAVVLGIPAVLQGLSAWSGYCWASECEEVKKKHSMWLEPLKPDEKAEIKRMVSEDWFPDMSSLKKGVCDHWAECGKWEMKSCLNYHHSVVQSRACLEKQLKTRCDEYNSKEAKYHDICWPLCNPGPEKCHEGRRVICDDGHLVVIDCRKWCNNKGKAYAGSCTELSGGKMRCDCS